MDTYSKPALRVLHVVRQYPPSIGGLEEYVSQLVERQSGSARVTVLTLDRVFGSSRKLKRIQRINHAVVVRVRYVGFSRFFIPFVSPRLLRRYDLIHLHALDQLTDLISLYRWLGIPPIVVTSHGLFFHTHKFNSIKQFYFKTISRATLSRAKRIFAVSRNDQVKLGEIGIRSEVLPNPVEPFPWLYGGRRNFIYWGRIAENKAVDRLIPFFRQIINADKNRKLFIVGSGTPADLQRLTEGIRSAELPQSIIRFGYLDRADLQALIEDCGYTVSASRYEGYGMVQVEGMSAGLLPVMQNNSAFEELFERSGAGLLLDFGNPEAAAERFLDWESTLPEQEHDQARNFALKCAWPPAAARIEAMYRDVIASGC
ncbi:glycosyltransferase family 4 protein [Hyphomicrobium sp.]|uniref:glycosyltransferase family 4 protein n=1 Tax=Hyphomicrobium sp. TaxID=82 RepID=UPI000FB0DAD3|nr:glycosyltransferase family 4 protein [Hyphomicrobium sp.]RUP10670.1 MAG: glycosyltransferase [Hyphomicrobium sp.]